jgi:hypothetical protein
MTRWTKDDSTIMPNGAVLTEQEFLEPTPEVFDATKMDTRMPFMYFNPMGPCPSKSFWVVKLAACWDMVQQNAAWMEDTLLDNDTLVPDLDLQEESWTFAGPDKYKNEVLALRKMQELWATLDFTGGRTA